MQSVSCAGAYIKCLLAVWAKVQRVYKSCSSMVSDGNSNTASLGEKSSSVTGCMSSQMSHDDVLEFLQLQSGHDSGDGTMGQNTAFYTPWA